MNNVLKKEHVVEHMGLEERILSHDKQLVKLEVVLERVANNQEKMSGSMEKFATAMHQLVANQETNIKGFERVHERIDTAMSAIETTLDRANEVDENSKRRKAEIDGQLEKINIIFVLTRYPKLAILALIGMYAFAISDVRNIILQFLKLI